MINKGVSKVLAFFLYAISLLPMPLLYLLADGLYYFLYYIIKYRRQVVTNNLRNSFPNKSTAELKTIEKEYFSYLADLIVEIVKMFSASPAFLKSKYTFTNQELVDKYEAENKSYLFGVGHYGNWEWNTIVTPTLFNAQSLIIYKPLQNEFFNVFFKKAREKSGTKMIRMKTALREIVKHRNQLTVTVFAADQTPTPQDIHYWLPFLNQETAVFSGLEKVAKSTNYPVIFCDMQRVKRGHYACDFKLVCDNPAQTADLEITKKHVALLENRINLEPAYWLWSHKRWKYKRNNNG